MHNEFNGRRRHAMKALKIAGMVIGGILLAVLFALLFGWVFQQLWNWLMPDLFGFKTITYLQAFGIVILAKILFGSFGSGGSHKSGRGSCGGHGFRGMNSRKKRKYFESFWQEEGKKAFDDYVKRMEKTENVPYPDKQP